MTMQSRSLTFAERYDTQPRCGFNALRRWFRHTPFWKQLPAAHRAVIDELYHRIRRVPGTQPVTEVELARGQYACSWEHLGLCSGATAKVARTTIEKAERAGIVTRTLVPFRTPYNTRRLNLFTWNDFDRYDLNTPDWRTTQMPEIPDKGPDDEYEPEF